MPVQCVAVLWWAERAVLQRRRRRRRVAHAARTQRRQHESRRRLRLRVVLDAARRQTAGCVVKCGVLWLGDHLLMVRVVQHLRWWRRRHLDAVLKLRYRPWRT